MMILNNNKISVEIKQKGISHNPNFVYPDIILPIFEYWL